MRLARLILAATASISGLTAMVAVSGVAYADSPTACHADTSQPRTYTHGAPSTGLLSRHGYYYLDVKFGPGCGLGKDGLLHVVAHVHALQILPSGVPGKFSGAYVPNDTHHAMYWLEFHGSEDSGAQYTLPGGDYASRYVSTTNHLDSCTPNGSATKETCQDGPGTSMLTLRYNGPDDFKLSSGGDIRFRIANESGVVITDFAQIDIVASATATAPIVG